MPIDPTIPLGVQSPMQNLSSLLNIKSTMQQQELQQQALQSGSMKNQQDAIDLQETQNAQAVLKNLKKYQDQSGNIVDYAGLSQDMSQAAPKNYARFMGAVMQAQQAHTDAVNSLLSVDDNTRKQTANILYSLKGQKPEAITDTIDRIEKAQPQLSKPLELFRARMAGVGDNPKAMDDLLDQSARMAMDPTGQQSLRTPKGVAVSNGQQSSVISMAPGTDVPAGEAIPGTVQQQQLPPTTPTIDPQTGQPGYLGPQGGPEAAVFDLKGTPKQQLQILNSIANDKSNPPEVRQAALLRAREAQGYGSSKPGFVASALPPGQGENIANNVASMGQHFQRLQDSAESAPLVQALTGNIKALASADTTGNLSGRKAYISGLLEALHLPTSGDLKTDTDLLEKNMAQLNLGSPAATDAARTLVQAARPNTHMSPEAVKEAADQVAAQARANQVMRDALSGYKMAGDVQGYQAARQKFEQVMDFRAFQYERATPAERDKMLSKMSPDERNKLRASLKGLTDMGVMK